MKPMNKSIFVAPFTICVLGGCGAMGSGADGGTDIADTENEIYVEGDDSGDGNPGSGFDYGTDTDADDNSNNDGTTEDESGADDHSGSDSGFEDNTDSHSDGDGDTEDERNTDGHSGIDSNSEGNSEGDSQGTSDGGGDTDSDKGTDSSASETCDSLERCPPCLRPQPDVIFEYPWQEHTKYGQQCYPAVVSPRCVESEYTYALSTPAAADSGWEPHFNVDVNWSVPTNELLLGCNSGGGCAGGGQFTYFQTFFYLGSSYPVSDARVSITNVDDGVRIALYNDTYPDGVVVPGGYMCQNGTYTTANFNGYLASGYNRIVMTQLDNCPKWSALQGVSISLNSVDIVACVPGQWGGDS